VSAFPHPGFSSYQLVDSGNGEKLERFGEILLRRPDPQALWRPALGADAWREADGRFIRESDRGGRWEGRVPKVWEIAIQLDEKIFSGDAVNILIQPTPFKHVGIFPEQSANWEFVEAQRRALAAGGVAEPKLLNLFGYTGVASLLAAAQGWEVTHCDASKVSMDWAAENAKLSGLEGKIRWMLEDVTRYVAREQRRGNEYHGILLDPPHYGRGPKGEKWQFETGIAPMLQNCGELLAGMPGAFLVLSTYAIGYSPLAFENMLQEIPNMKVQTGELALPEEKSRRLLPCGFCARAVRV